MRFLFRLLVVLLALSGVVAGLVYLAHERASQPFKGYSEEEVFFTIAPGATSRAIARELDRAGVVEDERLFVAALRWRDASGRLQAGEYRFSEPLSTFEVIDRLVAGDVFYRAVTIPEGLTLRETAQHLEDRGVGDARAFEEAFTRGELIAELDGEAQELEGYLFPETYRFKRNPEPLEVASAMVARFMAVFDDVRRERARELGLSVREAVTLASVVEKESALDDERVLIASVFWNRLERGMPLQSDPTIIYALKREDDFDGNLRRAHLKMDSPYNTYVVAGLPPGPIASPGRGAIDAVLYPADTSYLFFVSKNDGSHHFSSTHREHTAAVRKYQVDYFRNQRRRQQGNDP